MTALPEPPDRDLGAFAAHYAVAERSARRYERAMAIAKTGTLDHERLDGGWRAVQGWLERAVRLCMLSATAPDRTMRVPRRSVKLSWRQRLTPRDRHRRNLHGCLLAIERAADAAAVVAVHVILAPERQPGDVWSTVDDALRDLTAVVDELAVRHSP
ncbi:MAG TPA: hypothetical protein VFE14_05935 [Micromonosporaceae bacterium]|nr:hypothetical protein [Micromonosporaceae bacterium]